MPSQNSLVARHSHLRGPQWRAQAQRTRAAEVLYQLHEDHVAGALTQDSPDRVWIADVTPHCAGAVWPDLRFAIDVFHGHVVGWATWMTRQTRTAC